ncbi:flagellar basal body-associated protein FliL [Sulfitobacter aestuarii]|uniref:Flagellar protein FliL n=1 Tax=Sulfitobacter aestuarii TaxID=2161676 RepID=A0ABW5U7C0_9RHOB
MPESEINDEEPPKKGSKLPLLIGLSLALLGGVGGFFAVSSGIILRPDPETTTSQATEVDSQAADVAFVPVDPVTISLLPPSQSRHLIFRAQLEVPSQHQAEVERLLPRVVDVINSYLRALQLSDIEDPTALTRLRAQILRRVQIVAGRERVNDLLVMEFVLN